MLQNHSISQMSALGGFLKVRFNSSEVLLLYRNISTIVPVHCFTAPCTRVFACLVGSLVCRVICKLMTSDPLKKCFLGCFIHLLTYLKNRERIRKCKGRPLHTICYVPDVLKTFDYLFIDSFILSNSLASNSPTYNPQDP